jgi:hypothetical protein
MVPMVMRPSGVDMKPTLTATLKAADCPAEEAAPMTANIPVACTLAAGDLADQHRRWQQLMARALTGRAETPDGLRLSFRPEAQDELRALVAVEAACCAWAAWTAEPAAGAVVLDVRSVAEGPAAVAILHRMFGGDPAHAGR